jgi:hypothetical protein
MYLYIFHFGFGVPASTSSTAIAATAVRLDPVDRIGCVNAHLLSLMSLTIPQFPLNGVAPLAMPRRWRTVLKNKQAEKIS